MQYWLYLSCLCASALAQNYYGYQQQSYEPHGYRQESYHRVSYQQPAYQEASYHQQSSYQQHSYPQQQSHEQPSYHQPSYSQEHSYQQPSYQEPSYHQQPSYHQPSYQPASHQASSYHQESSYQPSQTHGYQSHSPQYGHASHHTTYVPVIKKRKSTSSRQIMSTHVGLYIPGGVQMFGRFNDLYACQKACELTPTCFAGDYNPWVKKCFMHSNTTACATMRTHPQLSHFKRVPCSLISSPRGLITLGTQIFKGLEQRHLTTLAQCIKGCTTSGGGVAATTAAIGTTPQLCFGVDFDFAERKCYFHTDSASLCPASTPITTPKTLVANPTSVNVIICPRVQK